MNDLVMAHAPAIICSVHLIKKESGPCFRRAIDPYAVNLIG